MPRCWDRKISGDASPRTRPRRGSLRNRESRARRSHHRAGIGGLMQMAKKQRTLERLAEHRRQREEEDRRQRVMAITEFDAGNPEAPMQAMAGAGMEYRRG